MTEPQYQYYLVYRGQNGGDWDWEEPTGGLVVDRGTRRDIVADIARQRYHCGLTESLLLAEVWEATETWKAHVLHVHWDRQMHEFLELMKCADRG